MTSPQSGAPITLASPPTEGTEHPQTRQERQRKRWFRWPRKHTPQPMQLTDEQLTRLANQRLQQETALAPATKGVTAEAEQGIVSLYGYVDTSWRKRHLEEVILTLPGVEKVINHLLAAEELADQLQERFQRLIQEGKVETLPHVMVEHQIVELYGEVATPEQRQLLEREALAVPGVRVVINHLRIPQAQALHMYTRNR